MTLALLGQSSRGHDLDLLVPKASMGAVTAALAKRATRITDHNGSDLGRPVFDQGSDHVYPRVDVIECASVADAIARFDIRACAVATDGQTLMAVDDAHTDLLDRRLVVMRPTSISRVQKYMGIGLDPVAERLDADDLDAYEKLLPLDASRETVLGLDLDLHVEVMSREAANQDISF